MLSETWQTVCRYPLTEDIPIVDATETLRDKLWNALKAKEHRGQEKLTQSIVIRAVEDDEAKTFCFMAKLKPLASPLSTRQRFHAKLGEGGNCEGVYLRPPQRSRDGQIILGYRAKKKLLDLKDITHFFR